jgi:hypothetical protein
MALSRAIEPGASPGAPHEQGRSEGMWGRPHPRFCAIKFILSSACRAAVWDSLVPASRSDLPAAPGTILACVNLGLG